MALLLQDLVPVPQRRGGAARKTGMAAEPRQHEGLRVLGIAAERAARRTPWFAVGNEGIRAQSIYIYIYIYIYIPFKGLCRVPRSLHSYSEPARRRAKTRRRLPPRASRRADPSGAPWSQGSGSPRCSAPRARQGGRGRWPHPSRPSGV